MRFMPKMFRLRELPNVTATLGTLWFRFEPALLIIGAIALGALTIYFFT